MAGEISSGDIVNYIQAQQAAYGGDNAQSQAAIAQAMDQYGVTPVQVASALGANTGDIQGLYNAVAPTGNYYSAPDTTTSAPSSSTGGAGIASIPVGVATTDNTGVASIPVANTVVNPTSNNTSNANTQFVNNLAGVTSLAGTQATVNAPATTLFGLPIDIVKTDLTNPAGQEALLRFFQINGVQDSKAIADQLNSLLGTNFTAADVNNIANSTPTQPTPTQPTPAPTPVPTPVPTSAPAPTPQTNTQTTVAAQPAATGIDAFAQAYAANPKMSNVQIGQLISDLGLTTDQAASITGVDSKTARENYLSGQQLLANNSNLANAYNNVQQGGKVQLYGYDSETNAPIYTLNNQIVD